MKTRKDEQRVARRELLKFAGLGSVAGAAAIAAGAGQSEAASAAEEKSSGYRETEHVRTYYELAKF